MRGVEHDDIRQEKDKIPYLNICPIIGDPRSRSNAVHKKNTLCIGEGGRQPVCGARLQRNRKNTVRNYEHTVDDLNIEVYEITQKL